MKSKLKKLLSGFSFTKDETRVILILTGILAVGFSIKFYKDVLSVEKKEFDLTGRDKQFIERSLKPTEGYDPEKFYRNLSDEDKKLYDSLKKIEDEFYDASNERKQKINLGEKSVNLNTATIEELIALPGVGEKTAEKIIEYRKQHGGFKKIQDIMKVKGIGIKKYENMKNYITVTE